MKKIIVILSFLLLFTGCNKEVVVDKATFESESYAILKPYKKGASYIVDPGLSVYNKIESEIELLEISKEYFSPKSFYYQEGQYFSYGDLKENLEGSWNDFPKLDIEGEKVKPYFINSVLEANFKDEANVLKGISLNIIVNRFVPYKNKSGVIKYKEISEKEVIQKIKPKILEIKEAMKKKIQNKDVRILTALYFLKEPNSNFKSEIKYFDISSALELNLKKYKVAEYNLENEYIHKNNSKLYSFYQNIKNELNKEFNGLTFSGRALYKEGNLAKIYLNIDKVSFSQSELVYVTREISSLASYLKEDVFLVIRVKDSKEILSLVSKKSNTLETKIDILRR